MKIDNQNETILVKIIEDICDKLDKTLFSSFKKVAVNEFDRFLKISTVEKQKILKKWRLNHIDKRKCLAEWILSFCYQWIICLLHYITVKIYLIIIIKWL